MATPRATGPGFSAYAGPPSAEAAAARHGLSPAHVLRFDANLPALPAPLPGRPQLALAERGEYPEGTYRELREAAAAYAGCAPDEVVVDAGADGLSASSRARTSRPAGGPSSSGRLSALRDREPDRGRGRRRRPSATSRRSSGPPAARTSSGCATPATLAAGSRSRRRSRAWPTRCPKRSSASTRPTSSTAARRGRARPHAQNLVAVRTLSKAFGLAGLRSATRSRLPPSRANSPPAGHRRRSRTPRRCSPRRRSAIPARRGPRSPRLGRSASGYAAASSTAASTRRPRTRTSSSSARRRRPSWPRGSSGEGSSCATTRARFASPCARLRRTTSSCRPGPRRAAVLPPLGDSGRRAAARRARPRRQWACLRPHRRRRSR